MEIKTGPEEGVFKFWETCIYPTGEVCERAAVRVRNNRKAPKTILTLMDFPPPDENKMGPCHIQIVPLVCEQETGLKAPRKIFWKGWAKGFPSSVPLFFRPAPPTVPASFDVPG